MSEKEIVITGIGGQGVQLAGQVLARAAVAEGRQAKFFSNYGGMMRGGNTEANVVVADGPIVAPPILSSVWAALVMHHEHWEPVAPKLRSDGILLVNDDFTDRVASPRDFNGTRVDVPRTRLAVEAGGIVAGTMVSLGVLCEMAALVAPESLDAGLVEALPSYRQEAVELNGRALRAGAEWARSEAVVAGGVGP